MENNCLISGACGWRLWMVRNDDSYEGESLAAPASPIESPDCCVECGIEIDSQRQIERPGTDICRLCELEYSL